MMVGISLKVEEDNSLLTLNHMPGDDIWEDIAGEELDESQSALDLADQLKRYHYGWED